MQLLRSIIITSLFLSTLLACDEKIETLPIAKEKFVLILSDLHVAEAAMENIYANRKDTLAKTYYQQVMMIHSIDRATLDSCIAIMQRNPELQQELYAQVMEHLAELEIKYEH